MTATRILPYRSLNADDLRPAWWFERSGVRQPLPELLPSWDYAREEKVGATVEVIRSEVEALTTMPRLDHLALVLVADCPSLLRRYRTEQRLVVADEQEIEIGVILPAGEVANKLDLSVHLILLDDLDVMPGRASRRGARVGSSATRRLILEGEASRFPTEAVSFAAMGLEHAPWTVRMTMDGLDDSFMGAVRLLVNEDHESGKGLLDSEAAPVLVPRLRMDVMRTLLAEVATWEIDGSAEYEEDSVGAVLTSMCELFFATSLTEAIKLYVEEPARFERILYAAAEA